MSLPKKNVAYSFILSLVDQTNRPQFKANPTLATGDFKSSQDGSALVNLTTLPVVSPAGSVSVLVSLSAGEMNANKVSVIAHDVAGSEWDDVTIFIDTSAVTVDDLVRATTPTNALNTDASGGVVLQAITHTGAVIPLVTAVSNRVTANVDQINSSTSAAAKLAISADTMILGTVSASPAPTTITFTDTVNLTSNVTDFYKNRVVIFTTGSLAKQVTQITGYSGSSKTLTVTPALTSVPNTGDTYLII